MNDEQKVAFRGAWHPASPMAASWEWVKLIRQWWNRKRWGCICAR